MNATPPPQSFARDLRSVPSGDGGIVARLAERLLAPSVARVDAGLIAGSMTATLPDGRVIRLGGRAPGHDAVLTLHRWRGLVRLRLAGSVGWYEAWRDGDWSSDDLVTLFAVFGANARTLASTGRARGPLRWWQRLRHALRRNDRTGARANIAAHYDLGNDFYAPWLDEHMLYSSALFDPAVPDQALADAQLRKCDAILDRLDLCNGDALLEIGCGWGALGARAVARHGVIYTGLTLSHEQAEWSRAVIDDARATVALRDYRDEAGVYDAIASVEMVEAVGREYWPAYLDAIAARLKPGGRAAIQYIAIDDALFDAYAAGADFIQRHIFPGGCLLSERRFAALAAERGLAWHDCERFGADYAQTLAAWREQFDRAAASEQLPPRFDADFQRLWRYYLDYCEGGFRGGSIWVAQVTLIKQG